MLLRACARYRTARRQARIVGKLQRLRHTVSPSGYTLQSFDRYRCIFVHIPKCAGVSVSRSLFGNLGAGHYPAATLQQVFGAACFESYFRFAFVRNPWDRLLSAYEFLQRGGFHAGDARWAQRHLARYGDFDAFVRGWVSERHVAEWIHFRPQADFLFLPDGDRGVDFIGRYEQLEQDFARVCRRLGIEAGLQQLNRGRARDYRLAYDSETRAIVERVYRRDIDALGYDFDTGVSNEQDEQHQSQQQPVDDER